MNRIGAVLSLMAMVFFPIGAAPAVAAEPTEPEMRAAVERYLAERNTEPEGSPRYFDATAIALFRKLRCEPPSATGEYACRYRIEVGTQYRESRTTTHVFSKKDGRWVSQGPRVAQPAPSPAN